jgi:[ribosomal protein S18]-alanine N-acetyltransferase
MNLTVSLMTKEDLPEVIELQNEAFEHPWTDAMLRAELLNAWSQVLLARHERQLLGFGVIWFVHDEVHILNLAAKTSARRQGIARFLLSQMLRCALDKRCRTLTLEVRKSNEPAIALYRGFEFDIVGLRKGYYQDNQEDALIMTRSLTTQAS